MVDSKKRSVYGKQLHRLKTLRTLGVVFFVILAAGASVFVTMRFRSGASNEKRELLSSWNTGDYEQVYDISKNALSNKPVDHFLLTLNGFSAYQLGISQINSHNTLVFIDSCICSLRKALLLKESSDDGRVCYVLGKAYSYKGLEYADLTVKYLELAKSYSYDAADIPEFLGVAYAAVGDFRSSVEAFTQAFVPDRPPSDTLLLSIARSYMAMEEYSMAVSYLQRCVDMSPDSKSIFIARLLLAEVFRLLGDTDEALNLYAAILNDSGENAEVHYQLGELYSLKGDTTRARSEWRLAYRQDPSHTKARARLNI
ncbi:MAG: tetratricopeptide repeat protein [Treponema sp.]|jgi:tetratricopeptide (TPR) repeat protein|nr:tetratricopeptide repeat protein [Treponema sp.]